MRRTPLKAKTPLKRKMEFGRGSALEGATTLFGGTA